MCTIVRLGRDLSCPPGGFRQLLGGQSRSGRTEGLPPELLTRCEFQRTVWLRWCGFLHRRGFRTPLGSIVEEALGGISRFANRWLPKGWLVATCLPWTLREGGIMPSLQAWSRPRPLPQSVCVCVGNSGDEGRRTTLYARRATAQPGHCVGREHRDAADL